MDLNEHISNYIVYNGRDPAQDIRDLIGFLKDVPLSWANPSAEGAVRETFFLTATEYVSDPNYFLMDQMDEKQSDELFYARCAALMVEWYDEAERPALDELFTFGTDDFRTIWGVVDWEEDEAEESGYRKSGPDKSFVGLFYKLEGDEDYRYLEIFFWKPRAQPGEPSPMP